MKSIDFGKISAGACIAAAFIIMMSGKEGGAWFLLAAVFLAG